MKKSELAALAAQARREGDLASAIELQRQATEQLRDDPAPYAHALRHVVDMLVDAGQAQDALEDARKVQRLYRSDAHDPLDHANAIRSLAVHAEAVGDLPRARQLWIDARDRYRALDARMAELTGASDNPGVVEAEARLIALR